MKKKRKVFSKIVRVSKLTRQRILQINNALLDHSRSLIALARSDKNFLIHGELTKANKAERFFSEGAVI